MENEALLGPEAKREENGEEVSPSSSDSLGEHGELSQWDRGGAYQAENGFIVI